MSQVEISATNAPGKYVLRVDLSSLTIPAATDYLVAEYAVSGTVTAVAQDVVELVASAYDLPADIDAEVTRLFNSVLADIDKQGRKTTAFQRQRIESSIRQRLMAALAQVSPGGAKAWQIDVPGHIQIRDPMILKINF